MWPDKNSFVQAAAGLSSASTEKERQKAAIYHFKDTIRTLAFVFSPGSGTAGSCMDIELEDDRVSLAVQNDFSMVRFLNFMGTNLKGVSCAQKKSSAKFGIPSGASLMNFCSDFAKECKRLEYI